MSPIIYTPTFHNGKTKTIVDIYEALVLEMWSSRTLLIRDIIKKSKPQVENSNAQ